jgi:RNA polymerase sigma-70 factor (ECF subfamily)
MEDGLGKWSVAPQAARIVSTAYRITRNWEDAEDVLQDTFLNVFIRLNRFEGRSRFSTWVTTIAINVSLMILRKKRTNKEFSIDASGDDFISDDSWELRDCRETPERRYVRHERAELLRKAIRRLDPVLRSVLEIQQVQEYSIQEISDSLGISSAAAKARLVRARVCLRTLPQNKDLKSYQSGGTRSAEPSIRYKPLEKSSWEADGITLVKRRIGPRVDQETTTQVDSLNLTTVREMGCKSVMIGSSIAYKSADVFADLAESSDHTSERK